MKKVSKVIIIITILIMSFSIKVFAHSGNITGWKDENSSEITEHKGIYYGYHKQNGIKHYHQVEWNKEKQKWEIIKSAVYYDEKFNIINTNSDLEQEKIEVKYNKSVDGDTAKLELNGEIITVRFLGIDTPETVHPTKGEEAYGKEASNYTKEKLENASKIEIEYDKNASKTDKYERHLAWIWVDDNLLQEELINNGLAKTYMLQDNYKYAWILQESQEKAQKEKVGIWSEEANQPKNELDKNINSRLIELITIVILLIITVLLRKMKQTNKKRK